jgi:thiol-disulfide isomerase/thioredoxin
MKAYIIILLIVSCLNGPVEININNFKIVASDKHVWVLEIASKMCGSCLEFFPIYNAVADRNKDIKHGVVYIDEKVGFELAQKLNVLQALPCVIVFTEGDKFTKLVNGDVVEEAQYEKALLDSLKDLSKEGSYYAKKIINPEL